jgi:hypothetical protein
MRIHTFGLTCAALLTVMLVGCAEKPKSGVKRIPGNQRYSGFLEDYSKMKANEALGGEALSYVNPDKMKGLRSFVAVIVDPVGMYVTTNSDEAQIPARASETVTNYFRRALESAIGDAFPIVDTPGPLVLRLRAAVVGVDLGGAVAPLDTPAMTAKPLERAIVLEKVAVEMELVDSETGERIAALVDRANLGAGAEVGSEHFSRIERFRQAREAFDGWASRVREFLDTEHELKGDDADRAVQAYRPYSQ